MKEESSYPNDPLAPAPAENLEIAQRYFLAGFNGGGVCASDFLELCGKHKVTVGKATREYIESAVIRISTNSVATVTTIESQRGVSGSRIMRMLTDRLRGIVPDNQLRLCVDMVPKPLHGRNLRKVIGRARWSALRVQILSEREHACEICGAGPTSTSELHAHEVWIYDLNKRPNRARLERIGLLCHLCHSVEHLGNSLARIAEGVLPEMYVNKLSAHFCAVNGVSIHMWDLHTAKAWQEWKALSKRSAWRVEFGHFDVLLTDAERGDIR